MKINPLHAIDFYKTGHINQYPEGTNLVFSNFTPRSNRLFKSLDDYDNKIVVFGLQFFIKEFLIETWNDGFFNLPKEKVVSTYKRRMDTSLGENAIDIKHIEELHDLGYLPLEIRALEEGTRSPIKIPVLTITNTLPNFYWLVNYIETAMSTELWKPMTNATIAFEYRRIFEKYANLTGADKSFIGFQGHDFSARGLSNKEDGYKSGQAHLTSFYGTDTVLAIDGIEEYYNGNAKNELIGTSVPATEHSVMCMGEKEGELETFKRLITETYPKGIISIVSDTWDFWKVLSEYTIVLKDDIQNRELDTLGNAKVVFRPDSGNPIDIICGYSNYKHYTYTPVFIDGDVKENSFGGLESFRTNISAIESSKQKDIVIVDGEDKYYNGKQLGKAEYDGAIKTLWNIFGGVENKKGYKTLNPRVGLIYGDSITMDRQEEILSRLMSMGYSSDNIVFGIGSYSYQYSTRDTFGFAMKATYGEVNNIGIDIFKDPITDRGTKKSAKGLLVVNQIDGELVLNQESTYSEVESDSNMLKRVFKNGKLLKETTFENIRKRLWS